MYQSSTHTALFPLGNDSNDYFYPSDNRNCQTLYCTFRTPEYHSGNLCTLRTSLELVFVACLPSFILHFAVSDRGKLPYQIPHILSVQFDVCWQERITTTHTLRLGVEPSYSRYSPVALPIMLSQVLLQKYLSIFCLQGLCRVYCYRGVSAGTTDLRN